MSYEYKPKFKLINVKTVMGNRGPMEVGQLDCSTEPILGLLAVWITKHYNAGIGDGKKTLRKWPYLTLYDATSNLDWEDYESERDYGVIYEGKEGSDPLAPYLKKSPALARLLPQLTPIMEIALCALHKELILCMNDEAVLDVHLINWEGEPQPIDMTDLAALPLVADPLAGTIFGKNEMHQAMQDAAKRYDDEQKKGDQ